MSDPRQSSGGIRVLVVDDEPDIRELIELTLMRMGLECQCVGTVGAACDALSEGLFGLCLTDMRLPDGEGLEIVRVIADRYPSVPVAVVTAFGSADNAVAALKAGAFDYLQKPIGLAQLRSLIKSALKLPQQKGGASMTARSFIGSSGAIEQVRALIQRIARSQAPVYLSGESGSGKELAARLIHEASVRLDAPFVPVNCGAIPEHLMESEFFGHRKGAFTGATESREGFFQAAQGGTLFLDEVADLPLAMQVKLLRAIQEKKIRRLGETQEEAVDCRIVCATHKQLLEEVVQGRFRQDLYYRLNVIELRLPPLRERLEDLSELVQNMLARLAPGRDISLSAAAMAALATYHFPGNVRELENIVERACALCAGSEIGVEELQLTPLGEEVAHPAQAGETLDQFLNRQEREMILAALQQEGGNRTAAARRLGVSFRSLRYRLERLGIDRELG